MPRTSTEQTELSRFFYALASPIRLQILEMVTATKRPLHIKAISDKLKMDYAATHRHIAVLKKAKIVQVYEVGRSRVVSPQNEERIGKILEFAARMQA